VGIYTVVFKYFFKAEAPIGEPSGVSNYAVFLLTGLLAWNYFSISINGAMAVLVGNAGLIKKVYFPREGLVLSLIVSNLITFFIELGVLLAILLSSAVGPAVVAPSPRPRRDHDGVHRRSQADPLGAQRLFPRCPVPGGSILLQVLFYMTPVVADQTRVRHARGQAVLRRLYTANPPCSSSRRSTTCSTTCAGPRGRTGSTSSHGRQAA
jgi:hypothetical protein